jgi:flagellar protein FliO/FliZ
MSQQLVYIALFLVVVACLPIVTKWLVRRNVLGQGGVGASTKILAVVAVGPHQKVVTLEAGSENERLLLILGVTPQQITCLHSAPVASQAVAPVISDAVCR